MSGDERAERDEHDDRYDTGIVVPVLIGIVAVTAALLAWRASQLDADAGDFDQSAAADAAYVQQVELQAGVFSANIAGVDLQVQVLAAQAEALRERGDPASMAQAEELEVEAGQLLLLAQNRPIATDQLAVPFDRDDVRQRFLANDRELGRHDPEAAIEAGDDLRDRGFRLVAFTAALAIAAVFLTTAQISRRKLPQIGLIAAAAVVWIGVVVGAVGTGLS